MFLDAISDAYRDVTKILLENKFKKEIPENIMNHLIKRSIEAQAVIDLENTELSFFEDIEIKDVEIPNNKLLYWLYKLLGYYDNVESYKVPRVAIEELVLDASIINSCKTDIEVLRATSGIIGLLLSSNQYVAVRF